MVVVGAVLTVVVVAVLAVVAVVVVAFNLHGQIWMRG